jgi:tetratricopeptide (TPR) repeat protein
MPFYYKGVVNKIIGDTLSAIFNYTRALELDKSIYNAYFERGECFYKKKDFGNAIKDFNKIIELQPQERIVYYYRGISFFKLDKKKESCKDLTRAMELGIQDIPKEYIEGCK